MNFIKKKLIIKKKKPKMVVLLPPTHEEQSLKPHPQPILEVQCERDIKILAIV